MLFITLLFLYCILNVSTDSINDYYKKRNDLKEVELRYSLGGNVLLKKLEEKVNLCFMKEKFKQVDYSFENPEYFNFSRNFFQYKNAMRRSKLYKFIKEMPKGAALHNHDMALIGPDYILNITYMNNLYVNFGERLLMKFADKKPEGNWTLMADLRKSSKNVVEFDENLRKHFTLVVDNPDEKYPTIKDTWSAFMKYFGTVIQVLTYRPVWEQYFYDALKKFREDNIMYLEIRSVLPQLYELDGSTYSQMITARAYKKVIDQFKKDYPDFFGAKLIFAPSRLVNRSTVAHYLEFAEQIKTAMPETFAGFDLVGQEDLGTPLVEFVPELFNRDFNYFFHAGETDWFGTSTDENLIDAILLGTKRIGHAYALVKHPLLMKEVVKRDIGLEVNVISNSVLSLVKDVRNHPVNVFIANDLPIVLSSDDPGAWEAEPLTDDFYVTFVGASSRLNDLRLLKKLAMNSLKYSALDDVQKVEALKQFKAKWNSFIENFDVKNC